MEKYFDGTSMKRTFVCFLMMAIIFHLDKFLLGPYALIKIHDVFESEFSHYLVLADWLKEYGYVGWYPNVAVGAPSHAYQSGPGYILVLLSLLFPSWIIYHGLIVLMMTISGYGVYRLLRDFFSISHRFSLFGGLLYACSSQGWVTNTFFIYDFAFPLLFVLLHHPPQRAASISSLAYRVFVLIILAWVSYPILATGYPLLHLGLIFVIASSDWKILKPWLIQFVMFWVGFALLYTPVVYSLLEYLPFAHRVYPEKITLASMLSTEEFQWFLGHVWQNLIYSESVRALVFPILVGSIPLMFISTKVRRMGIFLFCFLLLCAILGTKLSTFFPGNWIEKMDLIHVQRPLRLIFTIFSVVALDTLGTQTRKMRLAVFLIGFFALALDIFHVLPLELRFQMVSFFGTGNNWVVFLDKSLLVFVFFSFIFIAQKYKQKHG
ncbi:MAG: DUF6044 family protein [Nitrospinaceae bacterium]|nr:DUF6044 family protein [Nitrospinaceae bacterium]|tara:strand:+ start:349 stop:1656 length:1308 start_codon:yes stop_codon:yes gene_type:complete